ncbi:cytochrome c biogenesis protein ResB [Cohnella terricola]|uniref:Cytochrome c biogenesis protein ResB n=1 Tax=Cohnella terricola TaxID=1289167 RepID=A0A559JXB9_9BACL|nr:cytochrome c biogenesis protein ResB [Cohnella terricola]TVY04532.1 cytochrome c biogenesis protein ResB [Cohnella terricola]
MFQNTKCECGHQNPIGTVLCESCGKPLDEGLLKDENAQLEMRYDGVARRSQKANPHVVDRIWNFFSSVKIAVYLIVITLIGASLGTIFQQESTLINMTERSEFAAFYKEKYGTVGVIYHALGLSRTYESWWFITLLVMIGTSLVVCSLDRVLPLYRALSKQQIRKHLQFITRQQVVYVGTLKDEPKEWVGRFGQELKRKRYRVWQENGALLAEKNRFSRWGPYINHIGLIIFLLAVLGRSIPSWHMDQYLSLYEGETRQIPGTNYYLKSDKFTVDYYNDSELANNQKGTKVVKLYETQARLYECTDACDDPLAEPVLKEVMQHEIRVNSALTYKGLSIYQNSYQERVRLISVHPTLLDVGTGEAFGTFDLLMDHPDRNQFQVGDYTLKLNDYYPDFSLDEQKRPMTKSRDPNNPAFVFRIFGPGVQSKGEIYIYFPLPNEKSKYYEQVLNESFKIRGDNTGRFAVKVENPIVDGKMNNIEYSEYTTYLNIRVDKAMPYIWVGAAISMIGLIMGFYWQHRRIWLRVDGDKLSLGGHTNKNSFGLRADVAWALGRSGIEVSPKSLDNRRNSR